MNGHWQNGNKKAEEAIVFDLRYYIRGEDDECKNIGWDSPDDDPVSITDEWDQNIPFQWVKTKTLTYSDITTWRYVKIEVDLNQSINTKLKGCQLFEPFGYDNTAQLGPNTDFPTSDPRWTYCISPAMRRSRMYLDGFVEGAIAKNADVTGYWLAGGSSPRAWYGIILDKAMPISDVEDIGTNEYICTIPKHFICYAQNYFYLPGGSANPGIRCIQPHFTIMEKQQYTGYVPGYATGYPLRIKITKSSADEIKDRGLWGHLQ